VEPAACVCANIISTNMHSLFSHAYGMGADHYVDARFVGHDGEVFSFNDRQTPNPFRFDEHGARSPGICTELTVRLYPTTEDETAVIVPFARLQDAAALAREVGVRRLGFAAGVLGIDYSAGFSSPTLQVAEELKRFFRDGLGVEYGLVVLGDRYDMAAIKDLAGVCIDDELIRAMMLSGPQLHGEQGANLLSLLSGEGKPYEVVFRAEAAPLILAALSPSPDNIAAVVDDDMKEFYRELYGRREMTDLVWLNTFRILSSRIGRNRSFQGMVMYMPVDDLDMIVELCEQLKSVADAHEVKNGFGYLIPTDFGKRFFMEYDFYHDHTNEPERERCRVAMLEAAEVIDRYMRKMNGRAASVLPYQGQCRKEGLLYL